MQVRSVELVDASDVFEGCENAWNQFVENDQNFSWGDNNRTLISKTRMLDAVDELDHEDENEEQEIETVKERLQSLGDETYIDLEN